MNRVRLIFRKEGKTKYISHLDLMHTMQRAFLRAGISMRHTEGFNPHPYMSIALPLSVGCGSACELMDFDLSGGAEIRNLPEKLNPFLPEGLEAVCAYDAVRKFSEIAWLEVEGRLIYDTGLPEDAAEAMKAFFSSASIVIPKRTKRGTTDVDIIPHIKEISLSEKSMEELTLSAVISAQNPSLNPESLITAIRLFKPDYMPDFASFTRLEVFGPDMKIFR